MTDYIAYRNIAADCFQVATSLDADAQRLYESARQVSGYWMMVDLKASAAYRERRGVRNAFRRAFVFSNLVRMLTAGYAPTTVVFKELGDGVLVFSQDFRPILEIVCVLDSVRNYWNADVLNDEDHPSLEARAAISFGDANVVGDDFLGTAVDRVARLSSYKTDDISCIAVVGEEVRERTHRQFEVEYPFLSFGENMRGVGLTKPGEAELWISEMSVDRAALTKFTGYFRGVAAALDLKGDSIRPG